MRIFFNGYLSVKNFKFEDLKGYDTTRLYAYLAERYLSFGLKKY